MPEDDDAAADGERYSSIQDTTEAKDSQIEQE